jgi:hypothetical protein
VYVTLSIKPGIATEPLASISSALRTRVNFSNPAHGPDLVDLPADDQNRAILEEL